MASNFPGAGFGAELGVGGSMRRAEGMGTSKLFGSEMRPQTKGIKTGPATPFHMGPPSGAKATAAPGFSVMPHTRNW